MGKSLVSAVRLHELSPIVSSSATANANANAQRQRPNQPQKQQQPRLPNRVAMNLQSQSQPPKLKLKMETSEECRIPLAHVVADCAHGWFQDTLKGAKAGDPAMQLLVAQMYYSGYGVPTDPQKGHAWISKASRSRNSVWKSSDKHIGYRTSDSDSYELENRANFSP